MSEAMKKYPTKVAVTFKGRKDRVFSLPPDKAKAVLTLIKDYELSEDTFSVDEVFEGIFKKFGKEGSSVKGARYKAGFTQVELAKKSGIPQQHISEIENGKRSIGVTTAKKLAKVFKCDHRVFL